MTNTESFLNGFLVCALWSSTDNSRDDGGDPLEDNYSIDDFTPEALESLKKDCESFVESNAADLEAYHLAGYDSEQAGHDFWLTRNGHGAGFWDRGLGELGKRLSKASKVYGEVDLYVTDAGTVAC